MKPRGIQIQDLKSSVWLRSAMEERRVIAIDSSVRRDTNDGGGLVCGDEVEEGRWSAATERREKTTHCGWIWSSCSGKMNEAKEVVISRGGGRRSKEEREKQIKRQKRGSL